MLSFYNLYSEEMNLYSLKNSRGGILRALINKEQNSLRVRRHILMVSDFDTKCFMNLLQAAIILT